MALDDFIQKERWIYCLRHGWCEETSERQCSLCVWDKKRVKEVVAHFQETFNGEGKGIQS